MYPPLSDNLLLGLQLLLVKPDSSESMLWPWFRASDVRELFSMLFSSSGMMTERQRQQSWHWQVGRVDETVYIHIHTVLTLRIVIGQGYAVHVFLELCAGHRRGRHSVLLVYATPRDEGREKADEAQEATDDLSICSDGLLWSQDIGYTIHLPLLLHQYLIRDTSFISETVWTRVTHPKV